MFDIITQLGKKIKKFLLNYVKYSKIEILIAYAVLQNNVYNVLDICSLNSKGIEMLL